MGAYLSLSGRGRGGVMVGANSKLGAYSNKYGIHLSTLLTQYRQTAIEKYPGE